MTFVPIATTAFFPQAVNFPRSVLKIEEIIQKFIGFFLITFTTGL